LMMFAAAMTIVGGAYASLDCGTGSSPCDTPAWDFTMSGKTANGIAKGYKATYAIGFKGVLVGNLSEVLAGGGTVSGVKIAAAVVSSSTNTYAGFVGNPSNIVTFVSTNVVIGAPSLVVPAGAVIGSVSYTNVVSKWTEIALVQTVVGGITNSPAPVETIVKTIGNFTRLTVVDNTVVTPGTPTGDCCLETFTVYLYDKVAKDIIVLDEQEVRKMSVFGLGLDKYLAGTIRAGSSSVLESDVFWFMTADDVALQFVGFGKGKVSLSKATTPDCGTGTAACEPTWDWPSWAGWFTGEYLAETDISKDLTCAGDCVAVAGGTWSAKYNKALSASSNIEAAVYAKFRVSGLK